MVKMLNGCSTIAAELHSENSYNSYRLGEKKHEWRLLEVEYSDPRMNMAVEEAILLAVEEGKTSNTLRFWRNTNAVVLGHNNRVDYEVNLQACKEYNTSIVRRITGGGAVYQDYGNLNWSITMEKKISWLPQDLSKCYEMIGEIIANGIEGLGADSGFKPLNAITLNGKKICGMAMYSKKNAILCHGTLLVNSDLKILSEILNVPKKTQQSKAVKVTTLEQELDRSINMREVMKSIATSLQEGRDIQLKKCAFLEDDVAKTLYLTKYSRREWNYHTP